MKSDEIEIVEVWHLDPDEPRHYIVIDGKKTELAPQGPAPSNDGGPLTP